MTDKITRRLFMIRCAQVSASGIVLSGMSACGENTGVASAVCADPDDMTPSELAFRGASRYQEQSSTPMATCENCAYFSASSPGTACGTCEIFNGSANRNGHCSVWSEIG